MHLARAICANKREASRALPVPEPLLRERCYAAVTSILRLQAYAQGLLPGSCRFSGKLIVVPWAESSVHGNSAVEPSSFTAEPGLGRTVCSRTCLPGHAFRI